MSDFAQLGLPRAINDALDRAGFTEPFPIQAATIPDALAGRDVCGMAPTGSGKTLAFGLPILATVPVATPRRPTALVLAPTRELAAQIRKDLAPFGKATRRQVFAIYGGVRYQAQRDWLDRGVDVLVATPGRLEDLIDQGAVALDDVAIVAVDEADRMADMGFLPAVGRILDSTRPDRQTLLFSATLDGEVGALVRRYQVDPVRHDAVPEAGDGEASTHWFWDVEREAKVETTAGLVSAANRSIVFTRTRHGADRLAKQLGARGVDAHAMHGGRTQGQRTKALRALEGDAGITLVATDVAARGIHVDDVDCVVHYDPPNGHKDYLHRSGRTARAGASGAVVSLVMRSERRAVNRIKAQLDIDGPYVKPDVVAVVGTGADRTTSAARRPDRRAPSPMPERPKTTARKAKARPSGHRSATIHVGNLPWRTTGEELSALFTRHGAVHGATVAIDNRGRSKGYGLVEMDAERAAAAVGALEGTRVGGRPITVKLAAPPKRGRSAGR